MNTIETIERRKNFDILFDIEHLEKAVMREVWTNLAEGRKVDIEKIIATEMFIQVHEFTQSIINE